MPLPQTSSYGGLRVMFQRTYKEEAKQRGMACLVISLSLILQDLGCIIFSYVLRQGNAHQQRTEKSSRSFAMWPSIAIERGGKTLHAPR